MPIEHSSASLKLGYVEANGTRMEMTLIVNSDRTASLQIWMCDIRSRRSGELMTLGMTGAGELKELLAHAERTAGQLMGSHQIAGLVRDR